MVWLHIDQYLATHKRMPVGDGCLTEIIQAWEDYQRHPEVWRLNHYLSLVESVPLEDDEPSSHIRLGDANAPSVLDCW